MGEDGEMVEIASAIDGGVRDYEMTFNEHEPRDLLDRIRRAIMEEAAAVLRDLRDSGASLRYSVALKLHFRQASDPTRITDRPITITNGEKLVLSSGHDLDLQLRALLHNIMTKIDDFQEVSTILCFMKFTFASIPFLNLLLNH